MDIFVLDEKFMRTEIIDQYISFIWTERRARIGDFELVLNREQRFTNLLRAGTRIAIAKSKRVMEVETIEKKTDDEGRRVIVVKGRSLEKWLEDRAYSRTLIAGGLPQPNYHIENITASSSMMTMHDAIVYNNPIIPGDSLPFLKSAASRGGGAIHDPVQTVIDVDLKPSVYEMFVAMADAYDLGFRYVRNDQTGAIQFEVYTGFDRTSLQTTYPTVAFAENLDNLTNPSELQTTVGYKNVAYVFCKNKSAIATLDGGPDTRYGYDRRVLYVEANDLDDAPVDAALVEALKARGRIALGEHKASYAFDGEIPQTGSYEYEKDYFIGDLVEMRGEDGLATLMRVTEEIIASDAEGDRAYPTLVVNMVITPGSWLSWDATQVWQDATGEWATQP